MHWPSLASPRTESPHCRRKHRLKSSDDQISRSPRPPGATRFSLLRTQAGSDAPGTDSWISWASLRSSKLSDASSDSPLERRETSAARSINAARCSSQASADSWNDVSRCSGIHSARPALNEQSASQTRRSGSFVMPPMKLDSSRSGAAARSIFGKRRRNSSRVTRISSRAMWLPMQK